MLQTRQPPTILECTLRDGSYAIDFQFTAEDTARVVAALDLLGFRYIEVGHGVGLGASELGHGFAAATDAEYMAAAAGAVTRAKWGMFCIPGVASLDAIVDQAADLGMGFIRIGNNAETYVKARPFIERARKRGLFVCANFMKSYCLPPWEFADMAKNAGEYGAQVVYIVDSAGGMLEEELTAYIHATRERTPGLTLGFHGHNNLGLANANSYTAWREGCTFVDSSMMGLGRSSGNARSPKQWSRSSSAPASPSASTRSRPWMPPRSWSGRSSPPSRPPRSTSPPAWRCSTPPTCRCSWPRPRSTASMRGG